MQPYFIKSFKMGNGSPWEYQTVGECYKSLGVHTMKLYDFFGIDGVKINSIQRNENQPTVGQALPTGTVFSIGSILRNGAHQKKITRIKIVQGNVIFECVSTVTQEPVNDTTMINAQLFVEDPVTNTNRITEIQTQILAANPRPLRLRGLLRNRNGQSIQEFMEMFFLEWNNENVEANVVKDTLYADTDDIQTVRGKRRSLGDLFMIFRYYYTTCTLKEIAKLLYITIAPQISSCNCRTINKRVWFYETDTRAGEYKQADERDEFGLTRQAWRELLA